MRSWWLWWWCSWVAMAQPGWLKPGQQVTVSGLEGAAEVELTLLDGGSPTSLGMVRFQGTINPAKLALHWRGDCLVVASQMPFSALEYVNEYRFDGSGRAHWLRAYRADPSREQLVRVRALLGRGEIARAHQVLDQVLYPHHYFEAEEMALEFLCAAQRKAAQYHRQGRSGAAADLMSQAIKPFVGLVADWPWPALRQAKGLTALNDYGYFLEQSGRWSQAVEVLERVLVQDPGRTPAYLNLADALERLGREREAREHWQHYVELRRAQGLGIPDRVLKKLGSD